jgi:hypothetical protein
MHYRISSSVVLSPNGSVRCSASHNFKQNEQNIDMCIVANRSFYSILFDLEKRLQNNW